MLVFWLKEVSYHFVKPMVGYKAKQLIEVVKSLVEIVFARECGAGAIPSTHYGTARSTVDRT